MKRLLNSIVIATLLATSLSAQEIKESPKQIVTNFFKMAFTHRQPIKAAKKYISETKYIQHNPDGADGRKAFIDGFAQYILDSEYKAVIKRVIAEDDLVVVHAHGKAKPNDRGEAVVDIFRVEKGKIVQHWDVIQQIPEKSANDNTMF